MPLLRFSTLLLFVRAIILCMICGSALGLVSKAKVLSKHLQLRMSGNLPIQVVHNMPSAELERRRIKSWPTWGCGKSKFDWYYDETETSYILKGSVTVTPKNPADGPPVTISKGDFCTFPAGLSCTWDVTEDILKHYNFSQ